MTVIIAPGLATSRVADITFEEKKKACNLKMSIIGFLYLVPAMLSGVETESRSGNFWHEKLGLACFRRLALKLSEIGLLTD